MCKFYLVRPFTLRAFADRCARAPRALRAGWLRSVRAGREIGRGGASRARFSDTSYNCPATRNRKMPSSAMQRYCDFSKSKTVINSCCGPEVFFPNFKYFITPKRQTRLATPPLRRICSMENMRRAGSVRMRSRMSRASARDTGCATTSSSWTAMRLLISPPPIASRSTAARTLRRAPNNKGPNRPQDHRVHPRARGRSSGPNPCIRIHKLGAGAAVEVPWQGQESARSACPGQAV